jgi:hypothetical protein
MQIFTEVEGILRVEMRSKSCVLIFFDLLVPPHLPASLQ